LNRLFVGLMVLGVIILSSCNYEEPTNEEFFNELQKTMNDIDSYSCEAEITVIGNKSPAEYSVTHSFLKPNKYKIQYHDGKQTISFDGKRTYFIYPKVDKSVMIKDSKEIEEDKNLFLGYFLEILLTSEKFELDNEKEGEKDYLVISVDLPGSNIYRTKGKMWFDKKDFKPYKMVILNNQGEEKVNVYYKEFKYNIELSEKTLFN